MLIGKITKLELIKTAKGHIPRTSGCGFYKNKVRDKKIRRSEDKEYSKDS